MIDSRNAVRRIRLRQAIAAAVPLFLAAIGQAAHAQVGISVGIGEPGYYGQINIGAVPVAPQLIYANPMIVQRDPRYAGPPLYLRVPPGYERHWERHCREYGACGRPVYFVRDDWYRNVYAPRYRRRGEMHREGPHPRGEDRRDGDHGERRRQGENGYHD